jgi:hypothetical protein
MAAKVRMLKLLGEMRGFAYIGNRQPPARSPGLFVAQLRSHIIQAAAPRRRLSIQMDTQDHPEAARPVPIVHVRPSAIPSPNLPAP